MTKEFYQLVRDRLAPQGVAAFNILPGSKLYDSNVRTLKLVFEGLDFYHSGDEAVEDAAVAAIGRRDSSAEGGPLSQRAAAAQERYKFRFDVSKFVAARRIEVPKGPNGEVLTDDFAPANVYDSYGRRYRRNK
jgi:spermidine synthase